MSFTPFLSSSSIHLSIVVSLSCCPSTDLFTFVFTCLGRLVFCLSVLELFPSAPSLRSSSPGSVFLLLTAAVVHHPPLSLSLCLARPQCLVLQLDGFISWLQEALDSTDNWTQPRQDVDSLRAYLDTHLVRTRKHSTHTHARALR